MKADNQNNTVLRSSNFQERTFSIKSSGAAFDILSSKIYTDPILAIVRELSTNAYDAHVEAFNESKPFEVHLPIHNEPWFSIRDFGTGLSKEDVETIYTTYFESTRNKSNDYVGCLGLGSKSPFAYTSQFSITSHFDGHRFIYSAFKNEQGEPSIALLHEDNITSPNGLEIKVSVKSEHFAKFQESAKKVYRFFKTKPTLNIEHDYSLDPVPVLSGSPSWDLYVDGGDSRIKIVMGQVAYNVDASKFANHMTGLGTLVLFTDVGDCSVAANREELHYDQKTIERVGQLIKAAEDEVFEAIKAQIVSQQSLFEQSRTNNRFARYFSRFAEKQVPCDIHDEFALNDVYVDDRRNKLNIYDRTYLTPTFTDKYIFVHADVPLNTTLRSRLKEYARQRHNAITHIYLAEIKNMPKFVGTFGQPTIELSALPPLPFTQRAKPMGLSCVRRLSQHEYDNMASNWSTIDQIDTTLKACKVRRVNSHIKWKNGLIKPGFIQWLYKTMGFDIVYGVTEQKFNKIQLPDLETEVAKRLTEIAAKLTPHEICFLTHPDQRPHYYNNESWVFNLDETISQTCKDFKLASCRPEHYDFIVRGNENFLKTLPAVDNYYEAFYAKYPLLTGIATTQIGDQLTANINQYISLIEKQ
jgi:hypothetical protein